MAYWVKMEQEKQHFAKYLNEFEIKANEKLSHLSYGQKKKVLISFGLAAYFK